VARDGSIEEIKPTAVTLAMVMAAAGVGAGEGKIARASR